MSSPILIWGAGAIGGTLAVAFARAGEEVVVVDNVAEHVGAIRAGGLALTGPIIEERRPLQAFLPETLDGTFERTFLAVKAHNTAEAAAALAPHVADGGYVVSAQNGLNERVIARIVGRERTIGCFVNFGADYMEPGVVHFAGRGAVVVGELDGIRTPRIEALFGLMQKFDANAILTDNIWGYLWGKLVYGALLFATALSPDSIADVLDDPAWREVLTALGREVGTVASAARIRMEGFNGFDPDAFLPDAPAERTARSFADMVGHNRRSLKTHSGIYRDLAIRKRRTEVDAQLGPIVETGHEVGVPTPITSRLIALIHAIEDGMRPISKSSLEALAA